MDNTKIMTLYWFGLMCISTSMFFLTVLEYEIGMISAVELVILCFISATLCLIIKYKYEEIKHEMK